MTSCVTSVFSARQLRGKRLRCPGTHEHRVLRGRDPESGISWTKLAEPYPKRLCNMLAAASASDVGWLGEHRDLDLSRCAKCQGARIGEAANPGPRGSRRRRDPQRLEEFRSLRLQPLNFARASGRALMPGFNVASEKRAGGGWRETPSFWLSCLRATGKRCMIKCLSLFGPEDAIVRLADKTETQANQISVLNDRVGRNGSGSHLFWNVVT